MKKLFFLLVASILLPGALIAQSTDPLFTQFQFNFATPGARANAMGRAFIGLADDATAALTNPAGLFILTKQEVSFEFKSTDYTIDRPVSVAPLSTTPFGETVNNPSFISYVYPKGAFRLGLFRQEYLNYKETFNLPERILSSEFAIDAEHDDIEFRGENYGAAIAYGSADTFSVGATVRFSRLKVNYLRDFLNAGSSTIDDTDTSVGFSIGGLLNPNGRFSIGGIYEYNPKFEFVENVGTSTFPLTINVPDRLGIGVAVRPAERFTLVADLVFVQYSQLADDFTVIGGLQVSANDFKIDDATEFHFGGEQAFFVRDASIFVRAGVFTNPEHALKFTGVVNSDFTTAINNLFNTLPDQSEVGYTIGGGFTVDAIQIDAAYLISDPFNEFSTSIVFRF